MGSSVGCVLSTLTDSLAKTEGELVSWLLEAEFEGPTLNRA